MITEEFKKRFLTDTSQTGRYIVKSVATGKVHCVEPIDNSPHHRIFGDIDPADKTLHGEYGVKYKGSVVEDESL